MSGGLFALICTSCILCYTFQTFFNKLYSGAYRGPESAATPVFSVLYGLIVGVSTLAVTGFRFQADAVTWGLGLLNGFVLFAFNLSSINAARTAQRRGAEGEAFQEYHRRYRAGRHQSGAGESLILFRE